MSTMNGIVSSARERTMPKRFSTLEVSMVCSAGTSTRNSECSGRKGMIRVSPRARESCCGRGNTALGELGRGMLLYG